MLAVHHHARGPALRREVDRGDIPHPHHGAAFGLDHHVFELVDIGQPGVGADIGDRVKALRLARRRLIVVGLDRCRHVARRNAARRHSRRVEPQPHRKDLAAEDVGRGDARHRVDQRLHDAGQIVRDRGTRQLVAGKPDIHDIGGLARRLDDDRVLGRGRDQVSDLLDLGHHFGQRLVGIEIELDVGGDRAGPLDRGRGQVIDPLGGRDRLRQGRGDKALHQIRVGAGIDCGDRDRRVRQLGVLPDWQPQHRPQPDQQDQQADNQRQHRPSDKDVGERHDLYLVRGVREVELALSALQGGEGEAEAGATTTIGTAGSV